jgi:hypothetical protein
VGTYLQEYGAGDERRNRIIKWVILGCVAAAIIAVIAYVVFHNYPERHVANHFLADVNNKNYQAAYRDWGCSTEHPCPNYDYSRFMQDWGPSKNVTPPWRVQSTDSCRAFLTVNVQAQGSELQSLAVQRSDHSLSFAPAPECQERQWRWKQFFQRLFHGGSTT